MIAYNKYLPFTTLEEKWGFYVNTVGCSSVAPAQSYPNNKDGHPSSHYFTWNSGRILNGYYLVFISKGEGVFESVGRDAINVNAGTCFFLFPGVWHRYKPNERSGWEEYWVGFNGEYPQSLMNKGLFKKEQPLVNVGMNEQLLILFQQLLEVVKSSPVGYHQVITGITLQILGLVNAMSIYEHYDNDPTGKLIAKAKFLMRESIEKPIELQDLVKELPMGYSKFRKVFKEQAGISPNQYYLNLRLKKAKELLTSTSLNVEEVAYHTGFDDIFYFSKLFKKKNGLSPKAFRTAHFSQLTNGS
jgi:AraC-like DNA-binding protein